MKDTPNLRPCPCCGGTRIADLPALAPEPWMIGVCTACDFVFLRDPVDYIVLETEGAWETSYASEDTRREKKRGPLKRAARRVRRFGYWLRGDDRVRIARHLGHGKMLDIGCGDALRFGPPDTPYGIELSRELARRSDARMRAQGGYCLQGAGAERIGDFPEDFFDGVMMHSYLEHEVDFPGILAGAYRTLRPGGRIYIRVPNFSALNRRVSGAAWPGFRHPDHVNYFTPDTLRRVLNDAGFEFRLVNRHKIWLDDNIIALATKPSE